jgi:hypothetical protein
MNSDELYRELCWAYGEAFQRRDALTAQYRRTPSDGVKEWRDEANAELRKIRRQMKRRELEVGRNWNRSPN